MRREDETFTARTSYLLAERASNRPSAASTGGHPEGHRPEDRHIDHRRRPLEAAGLPTKIRAQRHFGALEVRSLPSSAAGGIKVGTLIMFLAVVVAAMASQAWRVRRSGVHVNQQAVSAGHTEEEPHGRF
jgi:hypothetical protein